MNNEAKSVPFDVVEIWYNISVHHTYTTKPMNEFSVRNFAIKIEDDYFLLGDSSSSIFVHEVFEDE